MGFWRSKSVVVTGHTGFKGSWLAAWLSWMGAEVSGYSLSAGTPSLFEDCGLADKVRSIEGDVADLENLGATIQSARPDVVFHLAAQALVSQSYQDPVETLRTNVMGTTHLLEAVRRTPSVRVVVVVTSDKCYRNNEWDWGYREVDPLGGRDVYSASKACAELVTDAYRASFLAAGPNGREVAVATARGGNVVGGGDWAANRLVPDLVRAVVAGETLVVRCPQAIRPWQHVLDCLSGYLLLAERLWDQPDLAGAWNFGPDESSVRSVEWVVDRLAALWDGAASWRHEPAAAVFEESVTLKLDSSKARRRLGWAPRLSIDEALELTAGWYRATAAGAPAWGVTERQIADYAARPALPVTGVIHDA